MDPRLKQRIAARCAEIFEARIHADIDSGIINGLPEACESPIEVALLFAISEYYEAAGAWSPYGGVKTIKLMNRGANIEQVREDRQNVNASHVDYIIPQFNVENYRADFCIIRFVYFKPSLYGPIEAGPILIECDGHDFHDRTPEQAERDRKRDRALQSSGYPVYRFTGAEIYRNPVDCAEQIDIILDRHVERIFKARLPEQEATD